MPIWCSRPTLCNKPSHLGSRRRTDSRNVRVTDSPAAQNGYPASGARMIILGINDGHDAGACLMADGRVILVSNEERRLNVKNYAGVPRQSIQAVFERSGIDPKDVDLVTLSSMIRTTFPTRGHKPIYSVLHLLTSLARSEWATSAGRWLLPKIRKRAELLGCLADFGMGDKPIKAFDHHLCHAA